MKKLFAILLVLMLSVGLLFTGCSSKDSGVNQWFNGDELGNGSLNANGNAGTLATAQDITGTWTTTFGMSADFAGFMFQRSTEDGEDNAMKAAQLISMINSDASIKMKMVFDANGTLTTYSTLDDMVDMMEEFYGDFVAFMRNGGFYTFMELRDGMSRSEVDAKLQENGMTAEEVIDNLDKQYQRLIEILPTLAQKGQGSFDSEGNMTSTESYAIENGILTFNPGEKNQMSVRCIMVDANTLYFESADGTYSPYVGMTLERVD